jgi:hypothetical protein
MVTRSHSRGLARIVSFFRRMSFALSEIESTPIASWHVELPFGVYGNPLHTFKSQTFTWHFISEKLSGCLFFHFTPPKLARPPVVIFNAF